MTPNSGDQNPEHANDSLGLSTDQQLECILEAFDEAWHSGTTPLLAEYLPPPEDHSPTFRRLALIELIKVDLEYQWRRCKQATAATIKSVLLDPLPGVEQESSLHVAPVLEDYLKQFPELGPIDLLPLDLVGDEYRARRKWGDRPSHDVYHVRFPNHGKTLDHILTRIDDDTVLKARSVVMSDVRLATRPLAARNPADPYGKTRDSSQDAPPADMPPLPAAQNPVARQTPTSPAGHDAAAHPPAKNPAVKIPPAVLVPSSAAKGPPLPERIGRFKIQSLLGRGSFGSVFLALDEELGRQVALKVPRPGRLRTSADMDAFMREARLAAQLRHPALVEVFDVGRDPEFRCYIVMQYIEGAPLNELLAKQHPTVAQAAAWIAAVAEAVHCAHKMGLVHCDLKPANILIDRENRPHVADFGLVVAEEDQRSRAGQISGSPAYMAPEQVRGEAHRLDGRTDIWSLGVILYEMLAHRRPFSGQGAGEVFDEILHRDPKPPRQIIDDVPADLEWICLKCLSKEVRQRYTTCMDLVADLRRVLQNRVSESQRHFYMPRGRTESWLGSLDAAGASQSGMHFGSIVSPAARPSNLPPMATSFIGRQRESDELAQLLIDAESRLITVIGPGGMGKTRLALQVAGRLAEHLPGGCWFADLTEAHTAAEVSHAVAKTLGVTLSGNEVPEQGIGHILEYRKPLLLILDNFEQAVEHAEATVGRWRKMAPQVHFLVTSRASLGLAGEREYELGPLATPPKMDDHLAVSDLLAFDSVQLFIQRAREVLPSFVADERNLASISAICAELEGIPLAVELAAARVKILKPAEIAKKLGQKFQLLQSSRRDLSPRQQTLWAAIDWSFGLLKDWEQQAFMQACLFRGGFYLEAAEAVIDLSQFANAPLVLDVIQDLRDKSLVTRQETTHETRFAMYQSVREYGERQWQTRTDAAAQLALQHRFATHFVSWADGWNQRLQTAEGGEAIDRLGLEIENLFAVQDFAAAYGDPAVAARAILAVAPAMAIRGPADQRVPRLERALTAIGEANPELAAELEIAISEAGEAAGDWNRAVELADRAVARVEKIAIPQLKARALRQQGEMRRQRGELDAALKCFAESQLLAQSVGEQLLVADNLASRGFLIWQRGQTDEALACYNQAEAIVRAAGNLFRSLKIGRHRGHVLAQQGNYTGALRGYAEVEATARQLGDDRSLRLAIGDRGTVLATQGDFAGAVECYTRAESLARRIGDKRGMAINVGNRGILLADRGDPQSALQCYEQALEINRGMQSQFGIAVNVGNQANALADLQRDAEAIHCFDEAETINTQMGNKFLLAINWGDRAALYARQGQLDQADDLLQRALGTLSEVHTQQSLEFFSFQAISASVRHRRGEIDSARKIAAEAIALADRLELTDAHPKLKIREQLSSLRAIAAPST